MKEIDGIYKDGKISLLEHPNYKKAKVKIRFVKELDEQNYDINLPTKKLGKIKNISRKALYGEYLSNRY